VSRVGKIIDCQSFPSPSVDRRAETKHNVPTLPKCRDDLVSGIRRSSYPTASIGISQEDEMHPIFFFLARGNSEQTKKDPHLGGLPSWKSQSNLTALGAQPGCLSKWFCPAGPAGRSSFFSGASPGMGPFGLGWKLSRDCTRAAEPARGQGP